MIGCGTRSGDCGLAAAAAEGVISEGVIKWFSEIAEFAGDAVEECLPHHIERLVDRVDGAAPMPGDLLGTLIFTVEQSQEFPLPVGEAGDTGLESRHSRLARFEGRHRRVGQIGEEGLAEHVPVAPPRPPVEEHLVPGGAEGPGKKLSVTAKSRETPPEHETRRLKYVVGLRGIVHECANKGLNPPLTLRE